MGVDGQLHTQAALPPGKRSVTQCTGGSLGSRAGLDWCEISPPPPPEFDPRTVNLY